MSQLNKIPFGDTTITVFNSYQKTDAYNKIKTFWSLYVIENAVYKKSENVKISGMVTIESDYYVAQSPNDTQYLNEKDWLEHARTQPNDIIQNYFTAKTGDFIVKGEIRDNIPEGYEPKSYLTTLKNEDGTLKYPNLSSYSFTSQSAMENRNPLLKELGHFSWKGK